jgi:hypothetical protein
MKIGEDAVVRNKAICVALGAARRHPCVRQRRASLGQRGSVQSKSDKRAAVIEKRVGLHEGSLLDQLDEPAITLPQHSPKPI